MSKEQNKFGHLIDEATKTPRTDEHLRRKEENGHVVVVSREFARQLETELAEALGEIRGLRQLVNDCHIVAGHLETERNEARAEIEKLKTELREISDSCSKSNLEIDWCKCCTSRKWCNAGTALVDTLLAAERENKQ